MFFQPEADLSYPGPPPSRVAADPDWTVLVPFFNERDYLPATIASLAQQSAAFRLILIDNGSTDGSATVAEQAARAHGLDYLILVERRPGKVAALRTGLGWVRSRWVATCDADTLYPPDYLAAAAALLDRPGCVVAGAYFVGPDAGSVEKRAQADAILLAARCLPRQCHAGGAGQAFCVKALRRAGGFDPDRWNLVLEDHEVIHRLMRLGGVSYSRALWCMPSPRKRDRASIRWTAFERLVYALCAPAAGDWFFYRFLAGRLRHRNLSSDRMRERQFQLDEGAGLAPSYSMR